MSEKIKVIYITFNGMTDPLGQSQVLPYLEGLSKKGIKFYLVSLEKNVKQAEKLSNKIAGLGIEWHRLKYIRWHSVGMVFNNLKCTLLVLYLIIFKKVKIIHARASQSMFSVLLLKKLFKIKVIFDMRGFWPDELADSNRIKKKSAYYKILKFLDHTGILLSDYVVMLTPEAKEIIENKYVGKNVVWMPTCVDEEKFENKEIISFGNRFTMVYLGSLWSYYDMPSMIDFFDVLRQKIDNAHFLILANNETQRLHNLFSQKKVARENYTIMTLPSHEVPKYLAGSDLAISFLYDSYSKKAAFPTKLAEYLISGLPLVINAQSDYIKTLVDSNSVGVVLEKLDKESYEMAVEKIILLLGERDIKLRCKDIAKKYLGKNICVDTYLDIYKKLE
jgi:glycosyltransferase involved in cell wall biosynthesis